MIHYLYLQHCNLKITLLAYICKGSMTSLLHTSCMLCTANLLWLNCHVVAQYCAMASSWAPFGYHGTTCTVLLHARAVYSIAQLCVCAKKITGT